MRFAFQFVPFKFALLSCAVYLVLIVALAATAVLIGSVVSKDWAVRPFADTVRPFPPPVRSLPWSAQEHAAAEQLKTSSHQARA